MSDVYKNPETQPQGDEFENRHTDRADYPTSIAGPGGVTTFIENNEKGILEGIVFRTMDPFKKAALGSSHDVHAQGIYADTGSEYAD